MLTLAFLKRNDKLRESETKTETEGQREGERAIHRTLVQGLCT